MTIIFYDTRNDTFWICSENEKMVRIEANDPNLNKFIPEDDVLYVENAHILSKSQFMKWAKGDYKLSTEDIASRFIGNKNNNSNKNSEYMQESYQNKKYIHPAKNGSIIISDYSSEKYPNGIFFQNKWDFKDLDDFGGEEELMKSNICKSLIQKNRLEIVDQNYVNQYKHKNQGNSSISENNLNKILLPPGVKARSYVNQGIQDHKSAIEIEVR